MPRELTIIYEPAEDGWWIATIPEIPGAFSQGRSKAEARANVVDALSELMAARREMALEHPATGYETEALPLSATAQ
ncbi:MAG: type II toxin-antitoxin system HicB family antitoxin [Phycisphaerales bacterium]|nr:type II toxin-antitoxin system HicB family antitoxin [Phycisphaerales bacterium]